MLEHVTDEQRSRTARRCRRSRLQRRGRAIWSSYCLTGPWQDRKRSVALQVKFSTDYLFTHVAKRVKPDRLRACGWWKPKRGKIEASHADFWVFALPNYKGEPADFIIFRPKDLLALLDGIHGVLKTYHTYMWTTADDKCWETRGLSPADKRRVAEGQFSDKMRDLSPHLNVWRPVCEQLGIVSSP